MNPSIQHVHIAKARGKRAPRVIPERDFDDAFYLTSSNPSLVLACKDIVVLGKPWEATCKQYGVSLGGVWKALKRHGLR